MQSLGDDRAAIADNAVILMSLIIARWSLARHKAIFPSRIRKAVMMRLTELIREYSNPARGVRFEDPDDKVRGDEWGSPL